jgi:hypothetical protein
MPEKALPNDPCPCGSGKKFKRCCALEDQTVKSKRRRNRILSYAGIVVGVGGLVLLMVYNTTASQRPTPAPVPLRPASNSSVPGAAPPGAAPPGKVWSVEHGHWHDAPATPAPATNFTPALPPPGEAPPGKVWSVEHGHWHDAPDAAAAAPAPQPPGEAPPGQVWSEEHGHWHDATAAAAAENLTPGPQPPGEAPEGKVWSEEHGHWHDLEPVLPTP